MRSILVVSSLLAFAGGCRSGGVSADRVPSFDDLRAKAKRSAKGILVIYTARWSRQSDQMEQRLMVTEPVKEALRELIVLHYDVDRSHGDLTYRRIMPMVLPTFMIFDEDGVLRGKLTSFPGDPELAGKLIREYALIASPERKIRAMEAQARGDPEVLLWVGRWYLHRDRKEEALARFEQALKAENLDPLLRTAIERTRDDWRPISGPGF